MNQRAFRTVDQDGDVLNLGRFPTGLRPDLIRIQLQQPGTAPGVGPATVDLSPEQAVETAAALLSAAWDEDLPEVENKGDYLTTSRGASLNVAEDASLRTNKVSVLSRLVLIDARSKMDTEARRHQELRDATVREITELETATYANAPASVQRAADLLIEARGTVQPQSDTVEPR